MVSCSSILGVEREQGTVTVSPGSLYKMYYKYSLSGPSEFTCTVKMGTKRSTNIVVLDSRPYECEYDDAIESPTASKTGYDFKGWYDANGNPMTEMWQYTENQTFTAKWEPIEYNVSYELDGGTNNILNPPVYTIEDSITLEAPSKPGYTFKGWYSNPSFSTKVLALIARIQNLRVFPRLLSILRMQIQV